MTRQRSVRTAFMAVAVITALGLASCTTASEETPTPGSTGSFDPASITANPALASAVPQRVRDRGTLVVASGYSYAPANFLAADTTTPIGYNIELGQAIGAKLGLVTDTQVASFASILPAIGSKYDVGISSFTISEERLGTVNLVSYFQAGTSWAVKAGNPSGFTLEDLCGKTVGVQTGTVQEEEDLIERKEECQAASKEPVEIVSLRDQTDVTTRLVNGSIDAMAADSPVIGYAISQTDGQLEKTGDTYDAAPQGIAVAKDDIALAEAVRGALNELMAEGSYEKILERWGNADGALAKTELNPAP